MTTTKTCAERIQKNWEARLKDILKANKNDKKRNDYYDSILSIDTYKTIRVCLSWGGPADYLEMTIDQNNEIVEAKYILQDWFDSAELPLNDEVINELQSLFEPFFE